jgi:hypothetical protein
MENTVNAEVDRILRGEIKKEDQDCFLRGVIAHIKSISKPTVEDVREFFSIRWRGAEAHENAAQKELGNDY